jgi:hypothetical protein
MNAYQTDEAGRYVGPVRCDPDPREPGRWLVPRGAVLQAPPAVAEGRRPRWTGTRWIEESASVPPPPGGGEWAVDALLAAREAERRAWVLAQRAAGIPFRGHLVASDDASLVLLLGATRRARDALALGTDEAMAAYAAELGAGWRGWSADDGVVVVASSAADMAELEDAAVAHIRRCDDAGQSHLAALRALADAGDATALALYRLDRGGSQGH